MNNNIGENNNMSIFNTTPSGVNGTNNSAGNTSNTVAPVNNIPVMNGGTVSTNQGVNTNNNGVGAKEPVVEQKNTVTAPVVGNATSNVENTIDIGEKYLPIGTVVMLKGGKKRAMITGFCSVPKEEPEKMYDYSGCIYPEGFISSEMVCLFNHEQIDKVYHKGLVDDEETKFKNDLKELLMEMEKDGITLSDIEKMSTKAVDDNVITNSSIDNNTNTNTNTNNANNSNNTNNTNNINNVNYNASSVIPEMPN